MVKSKAGTLALNTIAGNQSVTGLGFQPKLVLFQSLPDTANIVSDIANAHFSLGAFDGTRQWVLAYNMRNGLTFSHPVNNVGKTDHVIWIGDPPGNNPPQADYSAYGVSLDADGFTINIDNPPPINYRFSWIALAHNDLQVYVGSFTTGGGVQDVTAPGFTPEAVLFTGGGAYITTDWANNSDCKNHIGFQTGLSPSVLNVSMGAPSRAVNYPSIAKKYVDNNWSIDCMEYTGVNRVGGGITQWLANGFRISYFANPTGVGIHYIAFAGAPNVKFLTGLSLLPATVGTEAYTGVGFTPRWGFFESVGTNLSGLQNNSELSVGFAAHSDAGGDLEQSMNSAQDIHNANPSNSAHSSHDQRILRFFTGSGTIIEDVGVDSFDADGFTLEAIVTNPTPSSFGYFLIGDTEDPITPGGGGNGSGGEYSRQSSFLFNII